MKLKQFSLATLLTGVLFLIIGVAVPFVVLLSTSQNGAIGIIGGADTPTTIFIVFRLMNGWPFVAILFGISLIVSALFCLIFSKTVKNNCKIGTTALSLGLSALGAMELVCFFMQFTIDSLSHTSKHPVASAVSALLGVFCFFAFIILFAVYLKERIKKWSIIGFAIDVLTAIVYLPTFFFGYDCLYKIIT